MFAHFGLRVSGREGALGKMDILKVGECVGVSFDDRVIKRGVSLKFSVDLQKVVPQRQNAWFIWRQNLAETLQCPVQTLY